MHEYREAQGVSETEEPLLLVRSHVENKAHQALARMVRAGFTSAGRHLASLGRSATISRAGGPIHRPVLCTQVPTDYVTTCRGSDVGVAAHPLTDFQVQPLTVAYWTKSS